MLTPEECKEILLLLVDVPAITDIIAGTVCYSDCRPSDSDEDVTIGFITGTDNSGQNNTQRCTLNLNTYIKDVQVEGPNQYTNQPNNVRFTIINKALVELLNGPDRQGIYWPSGNLWISGISNTLKIEATKEHYTNIRVEMKIHDTPTN